jgi:hypothetical protein
MKLLHTLFFSFIAFFSFAQNVGIGTLAPQYKLHIVSTDSTTIKLQNTDLTNQKSAVGITFNPTTNTSFSLMAVGKNAGVFSSDTGRLHLYRHTGSISKELIWSADGIGRIGIGPGENLYPNRLIVGQLNIDNVKGTTGLLINNASSLDENEKMENAISIIRNNTYGLNIKVGYPKFETGSGADFEVFDPEYPFGFTTKFQIHNLFTKSLNNFNASKNLNVGENLSVSGDATISGRISTGLTRQFVDVSVAPNTIQEIFCNCPANTDAISGGGGHRDYNTAAQDIVINYNGPDVGNQSFRWRVVVTNRNQTEPRSVRVYAVCSRIQ